MEQDFTEIMDTIDQDFPRTVIAERASAPGTGYRGAYEVIKDWHADAGHVGRFDHCAIRPCYDVRIGSAL